MADTEVNEDLLDYEEEETPEVSLVDFVRTLHIYRGLFQD